MNVGDVMAFGARTATELSGQTVTFYEPNGDTRTIAVTVAVNGAQWSSESDSRNIANKIRVGARRDAVTGINAVVIGKQSVEWTPPGEGSAVKFVVTGLFAQSEGHVVIDCERQTPDQYRRKGTLAERVGAM